MTDCRNHSLCNFALQDVSVSWGSAQLSNRSVTGLYTFTAACKPASSAWWCDQSVCLQMILRVCLQKWNALACVSERCDLNQRPTRRTRTKLLSFTNPLPPKINIYKGQTEQEWKMQISSSIADMLSYTHMLRVEARKWMKPRKRWEVLWGLSTWGPSKVTSEKIQNALDSAADY